MEKAARVLGVADDYGILKDGGNIVYLNLEIVCII